MKLILISRCSDPDQIKALPAQALKLRNYAADIDPTAEYFEFQESAHKDTRKKFAELVEHIKAQRELIGVCFVKIDRFTRDSSQDEVKQLNQLVKAVEFNLFSLTIT